MCLDIVYDDARVAQFTSNRKYEGLTTRYARSLEGTRYPISGQWGLETFSIYFGQYPNISSESLGTAPLLFYRLQLRLAELNIGIFRA